MLGAITRFLFTPMIFRTILILVGVAGFGISSILFINNMKKSIRQEVVNEMNTRILEETLRIERRFNQQLSDIIENQNQLVEELRNIEDNIREESEEVIDDVENLPDANDSPPETIRRAIEGLGLVE